MGKTEETNRHLYEDNILLTDKEKTNAKSGTQLIPFQHAHFPIPILRPDQPGLNVSAGYVRLHKRSLVGWCIPEVYVCRGAGVAPRCDGRRILTTITEGNFLDILTIVLVVQGNRLRVHERESDHVLSQTDIPLNKGVYDIYCDVSININNGPWITRCITHYTGSRADRFSHQIRNRDRKCVISGLINPEVHIKANNWLSFKPAHIFPPEQEGLWTQDDHDRCITDIDDSYEIGKIDSCQNGILLSSSIHQGFEQYLISVNPDDNYKIVVFDVDMLGLDGRILDPVCRNTEDPHRISDQLLRWHFH
ncbi:hypothetical protein B9Z19DRAFT_1171996 [Tuber borchii]|uniref:Uncharacterized protein n=1 Tax=Tuber borchii TaxID=42251 RepID=A0A2T6ZY13_TUBBO|nr:hypothetical protein B9Z19DRAFT_1171996 [Tuber borchii]